MESLEERVATLEAKVQALVDRIERIEQQPARHSTRKLMTIGPGGAPRFVDEHPPEAA